MVSSSPQTGLPIPHMTMLRVSAMFVRRAMPGNTVALVVSLVAALAPASAAATPCAALATVVLPATTIALAQPVEAGAFVPPGNTAGTFRADAGDLPAFCRVTATLAPTRNSGIKIEVWMPLSAWNRKLLVVGNGAWGGSIPYGPLVDGVRRGYAAAATDTGHEGSGAGFARGAPEALLDFAERAVHELVAAGRALAAAHYDGDPAHTYFSGCSTGGRQALVAAQRFPADFDGIVAGAPGNYTSRQTVGQIWLAQAMQKNAESRVSEEKLALVHRAVLAACDSQDGAADGVLEDPTRCAFDPGTLICTGSSTEACLTAPQAEAMRKMYVGAVDPRSGEAIFPGLERGGERGWARWGSAQPAEYATEFFRHVVLADPSWDFLRLDLEKHLPLADRAGRHIDAIDPDLTPFVRRGGKLLMYAGWSDPGIPPRNAVSYYQRVLATMGHAARVSESVRLFMVPGMGHCGGGDGTSRFDALAALEVWVEQQKAPERIPASRLQNGVVDRTRPLCPFPQVATYVAPGGVDRAESFVCR